MEFSNNPLVMRLEINGKLKAGDNNLSHRIFFFFLVTFGVMELDEITPFTVFQSCHTFNSLGEL